MLLSDLLAAACRPGGPGPLPLDAAARLYGAVAGDLDDGNFGSAADDAGMLPAAIETTDADAAIVDVHGLRYLVDLELGAASETVMALCVVPGCPHPALTRTRLARVCEEHLGHVDDLAMLVLNVPRAADDRPDGWEEQAARDIRARRLEKWQAELETAELEIRKQQARLASLRREGGS